MAKLKRLELDVLSVPSLSVSNNITVGGTVDGVDVLAHYSATGGADAHGASVTTNDTIVLRDSSGDFTCNIMTGTATAALYSDLAEKYSVRGNVQPGMLVSRNYEEGEEELIVTTSLDSGVFGVISSNPAFLMNRDGPGHPIIMVGRAPVLVKGPVNKWDPIVPFKDGYGKALDMEIESGYIIAEALMSKKTDGVELIECFVRVLSI